MKKPSIKIATWNINSVRLRVDLVIKFLTENNIDVLCLQEIKTEDEFFPKEAFVNAGYEHLYYRGEKSYNGVAVVSKLPIEDCGFEEFYNQDKRHLSFKVSTGTKEGARKIEIHNFYIPAGGDEPDVNINPKFKHKLEFCDEVRDWFKKHRKKTDDILVMGDFNIAPYEHDVWSHKQLLGVVSHTPIEVAKLNAFKSSIEFVDLARKFVPEGEKLYSWWSYRNRDWKKSNRGRRLDHVWATTGLAESVRGFEIFSDMRDAEKPSDHVPVVVEIG